MSKKNGIKPLLIRKPTKAEWFEIRSNMEETLENVGPYQHNLISCTLRVIADKHGMQIADEVIDEFSLTELFSIDPVIPGMVGKALED